MLEATITRPVLAPPDKVFATLVDPHQLPEWNRQIRRVLDAPPALEVGAEWVVEMSAMGRHWPSRSRAEVIDRERRRFVHKSRTDDGNPSRGTWTWTVTPATGGSVVTVSWELNPRTFWRRTLLGRIRHHQLMRSEVSASLTSLSALLSGTGGRG